MRQWYQAKLGERLGQFGQMVADRGIIRRGASKMQDGTLGNATGNPEAEDVYIRVGDENHYPQAAPPPSTPEKATGMPTWAKYLGTALAAGGIGAGGLAGYDALTGSEEPAAVVEPVTAEPVGDRWNEITVEKWVPDGAE